MEDGKHMGRGFGATREMILQPPGQAAAWLTSEDTGQPCARESVSFPGPD